MAGESDIPKLPASPGEPLGYFSPQGRISRLAIAAMVLGILGIGTSVLGVGLLIGPVGLVLGIVALHAIGSNPVRLGGKGYAITGIVLGGLCVPLLIFALFIPSIGRPQEMANRSTCAANLRGIVQVMAIYASSENGAFPVVPYAAFGPKNGGAIVATGAEADMFKPGSPVAGSPLAGPWMLAMGGDAAPKQFICKSDPWAGVPAATVDATGAGYLMFQKDDQISYSFAYPWDGRGEVGKWWHDDSDASVPVASDMAPVPGTGNPKRVLSASGSRDGNSGNHLGEGQNVVFGDNHVDFCRNNGVGQRGDDVFTVGAGAGGSPTGVAPTLAPIKIGETPGKYDTVMVPERDLDTGKLW